MDLTALDRELAPWRAKREATARYKARLAPTVSARRWWERRRHVRTYAARRASCGRKAWEGTCQHCGLVTQWVDGCHAWLICADCSRRRSATLTRAIAAGLTAAHARAVCKWHARGRPSGGYPVVTLITLTVPSGRYSEDLSTLGDRRRMLSQAWNAWRSWYQGCFGERLQYAWTVECTRGQYEQGHVHLHAAVVMPFRDYKSKPDGPTGLNDAWRRLSGGTLNFQRRRMPVKSAARYVAKYATKGVKHLGVRIGAQWVRAQFGRRAVSTCREWWQRPEHGPWHLTEVDPPIKPGEARGGGDTGAGGGLAHGHHDEESPPGPGP